MPLGSFGGAKEMNIKIWTNKERKKRKKEILGVQKMNRKNVSRQRTGDRLTFSLFKNLLFAKFVD